MRLSPASLHNYFVEIFLAALGLHTALYLCNYTRVALFLQEEERVQCHHATVKNYGARSPTSN